MKNREKFAKEIIDIACAGESLAFNKETNELSACSRTSCNVCGFDSGNRNCCADNCLKWCNSEYTEPGVDWSKVPVDTPILVRGNTNSDWYKRYFAKYEDNTVYSYSCGATSWSADNETLPWKYAKLANEEDMKKYAK